MNDYSPEPIEPTGSSRLAAEAEELLWDVDSMSRLARVLWSVFMLLMAWACLWGAYAVISEFQHWVAWAFAVVLLEPIGIAALLAAVFLLAPGSGLGRWFAGSIRRARFGLLALLFVMIGGTATVLFWWAWETWKLRG
jgi:hypothetical protein